MEWLTSLNEALRYIETHLTEAPDAAAIAEHIYMSPFYFAKGFQVVTGYSLGEYIRNRRLAEAAHALMSSGEKVIDIALRYGYDTPESFTKAFRRFHGCSPTEVRRGKRSPRRFSPLQIHIDILGGDKMDYVISPLWGFKFIGFERTFSYDNSYEEIPKFWDEICEKYCNHTIYAGLPPTCPEEQAIIDNCIGEYGVCIDEGGKIRYLVAGRYTGGDVPDGMSLIELPQGEWAKFKCIGPIPEALQSLNTRIFKEWLPGNPDYELSGNYNIEWYSCDGEKSDENYESGIWLPIKRK